MLAQLRAAVVMLLALTVITGVVYPFLITGIAQAAFPRPANGSLIERGGKVVGSSLIGQPFDDPKYFWGRLSATTDANGKGLPYNGASSLGSNLGPTNPALTDAAKARIDALHGADSSAQGPIPVDLVTASGSGLDPHISPAAALYQVPRVAKARGVVERRLRELVLEHTEGRSLLVMGEPGVNVLELNLALDAR
jgi:K+-transporting ATPase ATPase C chain